ncbi:hypothetical protein [Thalassobellus suaedae]|uniref:Uncharacterized protein n=1 Tax=Thalassobellus suaedae TaxID=3074124 RepID=A0ABY9XVR3_9FLAO|nr:hypothetical protein RHP51_04085 [Flavobacteriaceae bacterium HL-DH14]
MHPKYKDKELTGFVISNNNYHFIPAKAEISNGKVIVFNDSIANPIPVRYGWKNVPNGNLYNNEDLSASPF